MAQRVVRSIVVVTVVVVVVSVVGLLNGLRRGADGDAEVIRDHVAE